MTQITLDEATAGRLSELFEQVQICDPAGNVVGQFVPRINLAEWEALESDITEEELLAAEQSTEFYTTEEVLNQLRSLEAK